MAETRTRESRTASTDAYSIGIDFGTESPRATARSAWGNTTLLAQRACFGGEIPVGPFARIGGEEFGVAIVDTLAESRSPAVLIRNHGVFTIGAVSRDAVKAAVMCEDVARTTLLARMLGEAAPLDQADVDALDCRYQNVYGQPVAIGPKQRRSK